MAVKLKPNEKRIRLSFHRQEDVALHRWMEKQAYERRVTLPDFILLSLGDWFKGQFENSAPEPVPPPVPAMPEAAPARPIAPPAAASSTDDGYEGTRIAIAENNALFAKKLKVPRKLLVPGGETEKAV